MYNGLLQSFNTPIPLLLKKITGLGISLTKIIKKRFEVFNYSIKNTKTTLPHKTITLPYLNILLSQYTSVNNKPKDLQQYFLIKLLLIKTNRGRSHAIGKPSRGQRTWSNAWTSYNYNKVTRTFITQIQKLLTLKESHQVRIKQQNSLGGSSKQKSFNKWF